MPFTPISLECALVLSDDYEKGLVDNLAAFEAWCRQIAGDIAGRNIPQLKDLLVTKDLPLVQQMALNAVVNGVYYQRGGE